MHQRHRQVYIYAYKLASRLAWHVSYTPRIHYTHLRNILLQLTIGPLVAINIRRETKFLAKTTCIAYR